VPVADAHQPRYGQHVIEDRQAESTGELRPNQAENDRVTIVHAGGPGDNGNDGAGRTTDDGWLIAEEVPQSVSKDSYCKRLDLGNPLGGWWWHSTCETVISRARLSRRCSIRRAELAQGRHDPLGRGRVLRDAVLVVEAV
jgi:hypothetical protein